MPPVRGRLVAVEIHHVFRDIGQEVRHVVRILLEIGLQRLQRAEGDELRHDLVVVVEDVVLIRLGRHLDDGARDVVGDRLGDPLDRDIGELLLEERVDGALRQLPALPGRRPGDEIAGGGRRLRRGAAGITEQSPRARPRVRPSAAPRCRIWRR